MRYDIFHSLDNTVQVVNTEDGEILFSTPPMESLNLFAVRLNHNLRVLRKAKIEAGYSDIEIGYNYVFFRYYIQEAHNGI